MTALMVFAGAGYLALLVVILALLRQLNRERDERQGLLAELHQLATRVRLTQLADESSPQAFMRALSRQDVEDYLREQVTTTAEHEGVGP